MNLLAALSASVVAKFLSILKGRFSVCLNAPIELKGNTLFIFLPDAQGLEVWQKYSLQILAVAHELGITHLQLQDSGLDFSTVTVSVERILATSTGIEVQRLLDSRFRH